MQWAFVLEGQPSSEAFFVDVPDGTTPPSVGEKICANGKNMPGVYFVKARELNVVFPEHIGKMDFGWSFTLSKTM